MYIESVPNRGSRPTILLRESWREGTKIRKRTLANLTDWPQAKIDSLRAALKGGVVVADLRTAFRTVRTMLHGHVAAVLGMLRRLALDRLVASRRSRERDLVVAMIVARIVAPGSKLSLANGLGAESHSSSLGYLLGIEDADENDLYAAMDWLLERQDRIERKLVARHLDQGSLVLYDVTSAHFEGRLCPLARLGYPHGGPKDKLQINIGMLADHQGRPVATEVFEGNIADPKTFTSQVAKVQKRFKLTRIIYVGDRGMITSARIREDLRSREGLDWITALRSPQIQKLVNQGTIQPSLFDEIDMAEITSPDYPGERLIVCRNPLLAEERKRKREALLQATEQKLTAIVDATKRELRTLQGKDKIALRVGKVLGKSKVAKHFITTITDSSFSYERDQERIGAESTLDGFYVVRTSVAEQEMNAQKIVKTYKSLSWVEQAFHLMKSIDLKVRPIFHRLENRVRAHVFLCTLAYYVDWHLRSALAPILFEDDDPNEAEAQRKSPVDKAQRSPSARRKAKSKRTPDGLPVQSFQSLLEHLKNVALNKYQPTIEAIKDVTFFQTTDLDPLSSRAFELLGIRPVYPVSCNGKLIYPSEKQ